MKKILFPILITITILFFSCNTNTYKPPTLTVIATPEINSNAQTSIGEKIVIDIDCQTNCDANLTNLVISYNADGEVVTKLDSGMNTPSIAITKRYFQDIREDAEWTVQFMDRDRNFVSESFTIKGNPDSQYGAIEEYKGIRLGMHDATDGATYFCGPTGYSVPRDSGSWYQDNIDMLVYFKYSLSNGVLLPSPTLSSPGETTVASGELYDEFFPELKEWTNRNYTAYDITINNGVTDENYNSCHSDSLLIHCYNDANGKRKYKWLTPGLYVPFLTAKGQHGIIHVIEADTIPGGFVVFDMKIQRYEGE